MFSDLKLKSKLLFLILPLLIVLIAYAAGLIHNYWKVKSDAELVVSNMALLQKAGALVHELQKERGLTSGFLSSKGKVFVSELSTQRGLTDSKLSEWKSFVSAHDSLVKQSNFLSEDMHRVEANLNELINTRSQVDGLTILTPDAIKFYTTSVRDLLSINAAIIFTNTNAALSTEIAAYYNFLQAKERAGIERALLSGAFASKAVPADSYRNIIRIISEQNQFLSLFNELGTKEQTNVYRNHTTDNVFTLVDNFRNDIYAGNYQRDPKEWFALSTRRINFLKDIEDQLSQLIVSHADIAFKDANSWFYTILIITFALVLTGGLISISVANVIHSKATKLTNSIHKIALEKNLSTRIPTLGFDEFGQVATELNRLLESFEKAIQEILHASNSLSHSAENTSVAIEQNARMVDLQKQEVLLTISAVEEMSASINEVAHNVTLTSQAATETDKQVTQIAELIKRSDASVSNVASNLQKMASNVKDLHDNSGQINEVISVIKSIADQTNLLALNAAIEAARAGEMGRGFAVVADEVRSLAQRTQQSTGEIENIISQFQNNTSAVYQDMTTSKEHAERSAEESGQVQSALKGVLYSVADIRDRAMQIATAAEEQASVSNEISQSISRIGDSANEVVNSSQVLVESAKEQAELARELQEAAEEFTV